MLGIAWLPFVAAPVVGYVLFGWPGVYWPLGAYVLLAVLLACAFSVQFVDARRLRRRLEPETDAVTRASVAAAIEAGGGADSLIDATLRATDTAIEAARRAGDSFNNRRIAQFASLVRARARYARTSDDVDDVSRALALAREAERSASERQAVADSFNEWLRVNGGRFMS
jgi:hypothetical protein